MPERLQLFICQHYRLETEAILSSGDFSDVEASYFSSRCGRPLNLQKPFSHLPLKNQSKHKLLCGCSCLSKSDKAYLDQENFTQLYLSNCFQLFAPKEIINRLIREGAYIITSGWLTNWQVWVKQWGEPEHIRQLFEESVSRLVLLDSGLDPQAKENLHALSQHLTCQADTITTGLDYFRHFLENEILRWRLDVKSPPKCLPSSTTHNAGADYAMALDLMNNLLYANGEAEVASRIMDIFVMMFAAGEVRYLSRHDSQPLWSVPAGLEQEEARQRLLAFDQPITQTESGSGFRISIGKGQETMAVIEVEKIPYTDNLLRYQNLALAMSGVLALSIENARNYHTLLETNESLRVLNTTKDKLFSMIGHDVRSPIATIQSLSDLLHTQTLAPASEQASEAISLINQSAQRTLALLGNLLDWAKSQTGQLAYSPADIELSALIQEVVVFANPSAQSKQISLSFSQQEEIPLLSDARMIQTVLRNLISNAIKFTNPHGKILLSMQRKGDLVEVKVSDNGVGMSPDTQKALFYIETNSTERGTADEKGSGLGLVLCRELVERLGGKIWVESEVGRGSDFVFTLPVN